MKFRIMIADNVGKGDLCDRTTLPLVKMQAEFEILDGNPTLLRCAYDDFLKAIEQQTKN
ncbi:hypothetical protein [Bathymodiolus platifrons methanotrophic gill symbiont]|uniref:hypothetical protein n=1 Tax=Bathymodiolus platifrons methanotrophic gill symbiont TaxID=113268 RepID=UPI001C8E42A9|nr:hypothetical protein [Bathymodiolus platifrons methanotrophic gill symbiont]